ncbi:MAG: permease [Gammaproteobacteria bacterium]
MSELAERPGPNLFLRLAVATGLLGGLIALIWAPDQVRSTGAFVTLSLVEVAPLVIPGILLAAWVSASGAGDRVAEVFNGRILYTVIVASAIGAITPVCGVTVLPLMAGLLGAGVPLAPIMAFWLSSPITDPAMLATTAATLGFGFALGKTIAAFGLGVFGGFATAALTGRSWTRQPLRSNRIVGALGQQSCSGTASFDPKIWKDAERRVYFRREVWATTRLILICLIPAFAAEYVLNALLHPEALSVYVGTGAWWAVPLAVLVGAPAYLDGYAALPLTRGLIEHGMSQGAAMAFLVSGGVVSIWGAMAIFPVLKLKPFLLYLGLAVTGSMAAGWMFELVA